MTTPATTRRRLVALTLCGAAALAVAAHPSPAHAAEEFDPTAPVAVADRYFARGEPLIVTGRKGLLGNDLSPAGGALCVTAVTGFTRGTVRFRCDGSFTYRPTDFSPGLDAATYTVVDAAGVTRTGRVTVVNGYGTVITGATLQVQDYATRQWADAPDGRVVDSTPARLHVVLANSWEHPARETLRVGTVDAPGESSYPVVIPPMSEQAFDLPVDDVGGAWNGSSPTAERTLYAYVVLPTVAPSDPVGQGEAVEIPMTVVPRPVVLLGDSQDAANVWSRYPAWLSGAHPGFDAWRVGDGQAPGSAGPGTIRDRAVQLARYVDGVQRRTHAWQVDVVAHGDGGLAARSYVADLMPVPTTKVPVVNRLVLLGTPHGGSDLADLLAGAAAAGGQPVAGLPGWNEQTPSTVAATLDPTAKSLRGVAVTTIVGRGNPLPFAGFPDLTGDGTVASRRAASGPGAWVFANGVTAAELVTNYRVFNGFVLPQLLLDRRTAPGRGGPRPDAGPTSTDVLFAGQVDVPAGGSASVRVGVTSATTIAAAIGSSGLAARWTDPSGTVRAEVPAMPASEGWKGYGPRVPSAGVPLTGTWTLTLVNHFADVVTATVAVTAADEPGAVELLPTTVDDGAVTVQARVSGIAATVVAADLLAPSGSGASFDLFDDGEHADLAAGDGVYGAVSPALPDGRYAVSVHAVEGETGGDTPGDDPATTRFASGGVLVGDPTPARFSLSATAQSGGTLIGAVDPAGYRPGSVVVLRARPDRDLRSTGWTVDGVPAPAGDLTVIMDAPHTVVASFGPAGDAPALRVPAALQGTADTRTPFTATVLGLPGRRYAASVTVGTAAPIAASVAADGTVAVTLDALPANRVYPVTLTVWDDAGHWTRRSTTLTVTEE